MTQLSNVVLDISLGLFDQIVIVIPFELLKAFDKGKNIFGDFL